MQGAQKTSTPGVHPCSPLKITQYVSADAVEKKNGALTTNTTTDLHIATKSVCLGNDHTLSMLILAKPSTPLKRRGYIRHDHVLLYNTIVADETHVNNAASSALVRVSLSIIRY